LEIIGNRLLAVNIFPGGDGFPDGFSPAVCRLRIEVDRLRLVFQGSIEVPREW
jgi:hypothetical protein